MPHIKDQMHQQITLPNGSPRRIISLVPSQTELLYDLGLGDRVVGITKFCVHPSVWFQSKPRIGGTKTLDFEKISALEPDLIIGNKEENEVNQITDLATKYPVWMSDITTFSDALTMIQMLGEVLGVSERANALNAQITAAFSRLPLVNPLKRRPRVAYFIWKKPWMVAGNGTFIHEMLGMAGFENAFEHLTRYPEVDLTQLTALGLDYVFLSSEPYPFSEKHFAVIQAHCPKAKIMLVDGEMYSWYGSRLLKAADYLETKIRSI
jgi:ABC-type Fe3+-hydroxamate transport system substrate-binding protein